MRNIANYSQILLLLLTPLCGLANEQMNQEIEQATKEVFRKYGNPTCTIVISTDDTVSKNQKQVLELIEIDKKIESKNKELSSLESKIRLLSHTLKIFEEFFEKVGSEIEQAAQVIKQN